MSFSPSIWGRPFGPALCINLWLFEFFLPLAHVSNYRGICVLRGGSTAIEVQDHLEAGFKHPELDGCGNYHDFEWLVHGVQDPKEEWSWALMFKFLEAHKTFHPVLCGLVRRMLLPSPGVSLSIADKSCCQRQRNRRPVDGGTPQQALQDSNRQRSLDGNPF